MQLNLRIWKGMQLYSFRDKGKFVGCVGVKIPMTAQQLLESIQC